LTRRNSLSQRGASGSSSWGIGGWGSRENKVVDFLLIYYKSRNFIPTK
jgi:hypothetical protein